MSYRVGVDVGGTFTDLLLIDENDGTTFTAKVPSTPADPSVAVLNGIAQVCERAGIDPREVTHVLHGTTVATNAVLTGSGARVGLVTTKGYSQIYRSRVRSCPERSPGGCSTTRASRWRPWN